jgi:formylglycine-generating enzyme required for sulfatase activity
VKFRKVEIKELTPAAVSLPMDKPPANQPMAPLPPPAADKAPPSPQTKFINQHGMEFALIPKGKAWLDGHVGKPGNKQVEIPNDFYLGVYEVTQEEWQKVMGSNPSRFFRSGGGNGQGIWDLSDAAVKRFPVNEVSWFQCREFAKKLNEQLNEPGWEYRLPTEAEWEYACRNGGGQSKDAYGPNFYAGEPSDRLDPDRANFSATGLMRPCKVGCFPPNRLGLYDIHGNVAEWCNDDKAERDASGNEARVNRGGSWWESADYCLPSWRSRWAPGKGYGHVGLRVARVPAGK